MTKNKWNAPLSDEEKAAQEPPNESGRSALEIAQLWAEADSEDRTLAEAYLGMQRGLNISLIGEDELRFARHASNPDAKEYNALLVPGTNEDGQVTRIQAIRFKDTDRLAKGAKITNGQGSDPFRLQRLPECSDDRLLVCEGPEDAFTLRQVTGFETWATFGIGNLHKLPVPTDRPIVICCDQGAEEATQKAAQRLADKGAQVFVAAAPKGFKDANDAFVGGKPELITDAIEEAAAVSSDYKDMPRPYFIASDGWVKNRLVRTQPDVFAKVLKCWRSRATIQVSPGAATSQLKHVMAKFMSSLFRILN